LCGQLRSTQPSCYNQYPKEPETEGARLEIEAIDLVAGLPDRCAVDIVEGASDKKELKGPLKLEIIALIVIARVVCF
jgi:hypothetical protein